MDLIFFSITILFVLCIIVIALRNNEVCNYRLFLVDIAYDYDLRHDKLFCKEDIESACLWFLNKHSYYKMVFMFWKPLTLSEWYTQEEIIKVCN